MKASTDKEMKFSGEYADKPSVLDKILFWLAIGIFAVLFAEVVPTTIAFPFPSPLHIYFLYDLFLISTIYYFGKPTWQSLVAAGIILSSLEAYLIRSFWTSAPGAELIFLETNLIGVLAVGFFLLPFLGFIIPVTLAERYMCVSRDIWNAYPSRIKSWVLDSNRIFYVLAVLLAAGFGTVLGNPIANSLSVFITSIPLVVILGYWRVRGKQFHFRDLLPGRIGILISGSLVIWMNAAVAVNNWEDLPAFENQLFLLSIYFITFVTMGIAIYRSRKLPDISNASPQKMSEFIKYVILVGIASFMLAFVPIQTVFDTILFNASMLIGLYTFVWLIYSIITNR